MMTAIKTTAILYVEDERIIRELGAMALEEAGFEVVTAANGIAALEALDGDADPFCAVVTDINFGAGPDGWAVARRARELNGELPIIYVSGGSSHNWQARGVGNSVMIMKPFHIVQIISALTAILHGGCPPRRT